MGGVLQPREGSTQVGEVDQEGEDGSVCEQMRKHADYLACNALNNARVKSSNIHNPNEWGVWLGGGALTQGGFNLLGEVAQ